MELLKIREILPADNEIIARIIRTSLLEYGGDKPGTAFHDYDTDHMFEAFQAPKQKYFIAEYNGKIIGGSGIKELKNCNENICELQKLYLDKDYRGKGIGRKLLEICLDFAVRSSYQACYLETFPTMKEAIQLYSKYGFIFVKNPMGNTGHCGCDIWMIKDLIEA